jgi:uncharacterized protein (TIGR00251 family)
MKKENIRLLVRPGSLKTEISGIHDGMIKFRVSSQPEKGKANKELIEFISSMLNIPKKEIKIISGKFSNIKTLEIKGFCQESFIKFILKDK